MSIIFTKLKKNPKIIQLQNPIQFVGLSIKTDMKKIFKDAARLGKEYTNFKTQNIIPNLKEPWAFVAYSKDFDESTKSWEYLMGDVVISHDAIPKGLCGYCIPPGTYAIFPIKAKFKFMWGIEIGRMKRYIYTKWLPASKYKSNGRDFEYHNQKSVWKNPGIDLYVGIEDRKSGI